MKFSVPIDPIILQPLLGVKSSEKIKMGGVNFRRYSNSVLDVKQTLKYMKKYANKHHNFLLVMTHHDISSNINNKQNGSRKINSQKRRKKGRYRQLFYFFLPALPSFLLTISSAYFTPLPLYGSGGLHFLIEAAN